MFCSRILYLVHLPVLLCLFSFNALAASSTIKVTSIAEVEVEVIKNGIREIKRTSPDKIIPGTEVIFTNSFENVGNKTASDIVINNPIPVNTEYKAGSEFGNNCTIEFSADGGITYGDAEHIKLKNADGKEYTASPRQYTHIRWFYKGQLASGKSAEVGFRAAIN